MIEAGFESVQFGPAAPVRWWVFIRVVRARPQRPRRGVPDPGFSFARGGVEPSPAEARAAIVAACEQAQLERARWSHQASHVLGADGRLIPLDRTLEELASAYRASEDAARPLPELAR